MAAGSYQLIWIAQGGTGTVTLASLPQTGATTGQAIVWNGSSWAPASVSSSGAGITQLTGDVTTPASSSGSTAATVAQVGGQTASSVASAVTTVSSATPSNTASALVIRDSSGNFSAGTITASLAGNATSATNYTGAVALSQLSKGSATTGQAIIWNGSAWAPATVSAGGSTFPPAYQVFSGTTAKTVSLPAENGTQYQQSGTSGTLTVTLADASGVNNFLISLLNFGSGSCTTTLSIPSTAWLYLPSQSTNLSNTTISTSDPLAQMSITAQPNSNYFSVLSMTGKWVTAGGTTIIDGFRADSSVTPYITSSNANNAIVVRDGSGNFSAGTITANLTGTASSATSYTGAITLSQISQSSATSGQVIAWNGTAWAPATVASGTGGINQLNGDVTTPASSSGNTTATVAQVGGKTASAVASAVTTVAAATNSNTASTLVMRDSSGNFSAGTITGALSGNATTATTATNYTGAVTLSQLAQTSATTGQLIAWNGSAWVPTTVSSGITALTGDVTASGSGSQAATVAQVGGKTASAVASAVTTVAAAASANTASTLVIRDSSGNFSAGTITASLTGNATNITGTLALAQLAQGGATSAQVLTWNGSAWAPATPSSGGTGITQLTGDVTTPASSSGSTAATVAQVGGQTAASVATAATSVAAATVNATPSTLAFRDTTGAIYSTAGCTSISGGASVTATAVLSNTTYVSTSGANTVALIVNPSSYSYKYKFLCNGGSFTINPPSGGTFYWFNGSSTSALNQVNVNSGSYLEVTGINGSGSYFVTNMQGNWQSAGNPLGIYSTISYPSTSGYVLTSTGTTGGAAWAAPGGGNTGFPSYITIVNKTAAYTAVSTDAGKCFTNTGSTLLPTPFTLPAISGLTIGYTIYFLQTAGTGVSTIRVTPNSADRISSSAGVTTASTGYIQTSTSRGTGQEIGLTAVSANNWFATGGYAFDWSVN